MELIISQEQFKQNQRNGRLLAEIKKNKEKQQLTKDASKMIILICLIGLAIMFFGMIGA
jgi:hypothetical protein